MIHKNTSRILILVALLATTANVHAQIQEEKIIDGETLPYTSTDTELHGVTMYYNDSQLSFAEVDEDGDGTPEQWVLFDDTTTVRKELQDSDGDGTPDITFTYDADESLRSQEGEGLSQYEPKIEERTIQDEGGAVAQQETDTTDYAGDLSDIEKLAGESGGWWRWLLFLCIVGGGAYWWKRNKQKQQ